MSNNERNPEKEVIIIHSKYKGNDYDNWMDIIRGSDKKKLSSEVYNHAIYIDKYEGLAWDDKDVIDLLKFLGIKVTEVNHILDDNHVLNFNEEKN